MGYIGKKPTPVPLTASDVTDGIITSAKIADGTITSSDLASGVGGKFLQIQHAEITTRPSLSATNTYTDITGLSFTITPSSTSNKILLTLSIGKCSNDSVSAAFRLVRTISATSTNLGADGDSNRQGALVSHFSYSTSDNNHDNGLHATYLDSPNTTSEITYKVQWISQGTAYLNRSTPDTDNEQVHQVRTRSRVYGFEIGA